MTVHLALCSFFFLSSFFFLRQNLPLLSRLECSDVILAHRKHCLRDSGNSPASASQVAGITGAHHNAWLYFVLLGEMRFYHVGQAGLILLASSDPPALASQCPGVTGMSHRAWPLLTSWSQTSGFQNGGKINWCLIYPVCDSLLWQP